MRNKLDTARQDRSREALVGMNLLKWWNRWKMMMNDALPVRLQQVDALAWKRARHRNRTNHSRPTLSASNYCLLRPLLDRFPTSSSNTITQRARPQSTFYATYSQRHHKSTPAKPFFDAIAYNTP